MCRFLFLLFNLLIISFSVPQNPTNNSKKIIWDKFFNFKEKKLDIKIINGYEAEENGYPYHVGIFPKCATYYCSGSLVSETRILTTASCGRLLICGGGQLFFGYNNLVSQTNENQQIIAYKNVLIHEDFVSEGVNDIAIIELEHQVQLNTIVKTMNLDQSSYDHSLEEAVVTGWGNTLSPINTIKSSNLTYFYGSILSNDVCKNINSELHSLIQPSHICLSSIDENGANIYGPGDSGSPLVVGGVQVGIGVFSSGHISIFTRVAIFQSWIKERCPNCTFDKTSNSNEIKMSGFLIVTLLIMQKFLDID